MGRLMRCLGRRARAGLPVVFCAALVVLWSAAPVPGHAAARRQPVLAVDPFPAVVGFEYRAGALAHWAARGASGAVLLLVDAGPGLRPLGPAQVERLARIRAGGSAAATERDLMSYELSLVRTAAALGVIREVVWVSPFDHFRTPDAAAMVKGVLRDSGVAADELRTLVLKDGCVRGTVAGVRFAACGIDGLPEIADPVLLSIDAEFALAAASSWASNPVAEIERLFYVLSLKKYAVADAVVTASVENGFVPPDLRWIGETVTHAVADPGMFARPEVPKRWRRLQNLVKLLGAQSYGDLHHELQPMLTVYEDDPALQLLAAEALAGLGRKDEAFERAKLACQLSPEYCSGLPWIGLNLLGDGDVDGAERFFAAVAERKLPTTVGQLQRGLLLLGTGRRTLALQAFRALSDAGKVVPGAFLAGSLMLEGGDRKEAIRQFDLAVEALRLNPDARAENPETAAAVRAAARLYREEGAADQAALLEGIPGLMQHPDEKPASSP